MARRNAREHVSGDEVRLKKYFYVLRPLLAIRYIEQGKGAPPVAFERLVAAVAPLDLRGHIDRLLEQKRSAPELGYGPPVPEVGRFIREELERHGDLFSGQGRPDLLTREDVMEELNHLFRDAVLGEGAHHTMR